MFRYHATAGTGAPALILLNGGHATDFWGLACNSAEAAGALFIKLWWQGNSNTAPVLGTTAPDVTIPIPTTGLFFVMPEALIMGGPMYWAATKVASDTDNTALVTGGDVLTLFLG